MRTMSWLPSSTTRSSRPSRSSRSTRRPRGVSSGRRPATATVSLFSSALACSPNGLAMPWSLTTSPVSLRPLASQTTRPSSRSTDTSQSCSLSQLSEFASSSTRSAVARCSSRPASECWCPSLLRLSDLPNTPRPRVLQLAMQSLSSFLSTSSSTTWASAVYSFHTRRRFFPTEFVQRYALSYPIVPTSSKAPG